MIFTQNLFMKEHLHCSSLNNLICLTKVKNKKTYKVNKYLKCQIFTNLDYGSLKCDMLIIII